MSRAGRLLFWAALWWSMLVGVASATSCVSFEDVRKRAVADFSGHVVKEQARGPTLEVDSVRRGSLQAGERVEVVDIDPPGMVGKVIFSVGDRYRVLPSVERRPYQLSGFCSTKLLPGHVAVAEEEEGGIRTLGLIGLVVAVGALAAIAMVLNRRKPPMSPSVEARD